MSDAALKRALGAKSDSLSLVKFFRKTYSPDWNSSVSVTAKNGKKALVTRLGTQSASSDTSFSVVRTFVAQLDANGNVSRGDLVSFSNAEKKSTTGSFSEYARKWLSGEHYGNESMFVFQRAPSYKVLGSWFYPSNASRAVVQVSPFRKKVDNVVAYASSKNIKDICFLHCDYVPGGTVSWPGVGSWDYPAYWSCYVGSCFDDIGGGGGGGVGGGGGGGGGGSDSGEDECESDDPNDKDCDGHDDRCNATQIALAEEHESYGHDLAYPCEKFSTNYAYLIPQKKRNGEPTNGYESKHGGYGLVSGGLISMYSQAASYLVTRSIYESAWRVNSGYRCPEGNRTVENSHYRSRHMCGHAADLGSNTGTLWPSDFAEEMADAMKKLLPTSLSHTKGSYVHIDTDTCPVDSWSF